MQSLRIGDGSGQPLRILCLGAHCDDIEIGCGGTICSLIADHAEVDVHWVVFGSDPVREKEARASADDFLAGCREKRVDLKGFRDSFFPSSWAEIKEAFDVVKQGFDPDLVLTHHKEDLHQDHRTLSELTWNTFRNHLVLEYEIPKYDADLGKPNVFVPITRETAERKVDAILRHFQSQAGRDWFDAETFWAMLRLRGLECSSPTRYAEAFHGRKLTLGHS